MLLTYHLATGGGPAGLQPRRRPEAAPKSPPARADRDGDAASNPLRNDV